LGQSCARAYCGAHALSSGQDRKCGYLDKAYLHVGQTSHVCLDIMSVCAFRIGKYAAVVPSLVNQEVGHQLSPVHTTRGTQRQSDAIPFISMESWRFPATRATAAVSDRWRPDVGVSSDATKFRISQL
ncbi:hypothetical protein M9458_055846, partial [Cirrhinus mrigala]